MPGRSQACFLRRESLFRAVSVTLAPSFGTRFPGIFRGALDVRAREINEDMKMAAALALANLVPEEVLSPDYIIPEPFDKRVVPAVSKAVAKAAKDSGIART